MATEVVYTVKPNGGDYTSFTTAVAGIAASGIDWVTTDQQPVIEFTAGTYDGAGYIDERLTINIPNTDATHPLIIRPATSADWSDGTLGTGLRINNNWGYNEVIKLAGYVKLYGLGTENHGSYGEAVGPDLSGTIGDIRFIGCLIHGRYNTVVFTSDNVSFVGCRITGDGIAGTRGLRYNTKIYNCIVDTQRTGYQSESIASLYPTWVNCTAWNNSLVTYDQVSESDANSYNNASPNYTAEGVPGANSLQQDVVSGDYTDTAGGDFSLSESSALRRIGADASTQLGDDWLDITGKPFHPLLPSIGPYQAPESIDIQTVFTTETPVVTGVSDTDYELGMKFGSTSDGEVHTIRFWKDAAEFGTHTGRIWSSTGTLLASVVFADETASGWQSQVLATPLAIVANTTYVVSVNTNGRYVFTSSGLATSIINGSLYTLDDGNGVFDTTPGVFPTEVFNDSNYFRDVAFVASAATGPVGSGVIVEPAQDTVAGSGVVTWPTRVGAGAVSESAQDIAAGSGVVVDGTRVGVGAVSETGVDTAVGSGVVVWPVRVGAGAVTESTADVAAGSGVVIWPERVGTAPIVETGADTASGAGVTTTAERVGAGPVVESTGDVASGTGTVIWPTLVGVAAIVESAFDNVTGSGVVTWPVVVGAAAIVENTPDTATGSGVVVWPTVVGAGAISETGADTVSATGVVGFSGVAGTANITESGADTATGAGVVVWPERVGAAAVVEPATDVLSASGVVVPPEVIGAAAIVEPAADTVTGSGSVFLSALVGSANVVEGATDVVIGSGSVFWSLPVGVGAITEPQNDTVTASGVVFIVGSGAITEAADTVQASGSTAGPVDTDSRVVDYDRFNRTAVRVLGQPVQIVNGVNIYSVNAVVETGEIKDDYSDSRTRRRLRRLQVRVIETDVAGITIDSNTVFRFNGNDHEVYERPESNRYGMLIVRMRE